MTTKVSLHHVVVEAPDGPAALALEHRLAHLSPVSIAHDEHWVVEIPAVEAPIEVEAAVRGWLAEVGAASTLMRVDGQASTVEAAPIHHWRSPGRHVATNAGFIG